MQKRYSQLLVSVRSTVEAEAALIGGADLIDIKEPARGALGRADDATIHDIVHTVAGRRPVSAALGELAEHSPDNHFSENVSALAFVKFGLAGCASRRDWRTALTAACGLAPPPPLVVPVAYADWQLAGAPPPEDVIDFACAHSGNVLLLDTWDKTGGRTLLHWLARPPLAAICQRCHECGVRVALAGSLGFAEIEELLDLQPDWFAVRGAVCEQGRSGPVSANKVRRLARLLHAELPAATVGS